MPVTAPKPAAVEAAPRMDIKVKTPPPLDKDPALADLTIAQLKDKVVKLEQAEAKCKEAGLEELPDIQRTLQAVRQAIKGQQPDGRRLDQTAQKVKRATAAKVKQEDHIKDLQGQLQQAKDDLAQLVTEEKEAMAELDKAKAAVVQTADLTVPTPALDSAAAGITTALSAALRTATAAGKEVSEAEVAYFIRQHLAALTASILKPPPMHGKDVPPPVLPPPAKEHEETTARVSGGATDPVLPPPEKEHGVTAARLPGGAPDPDAADMEGVEAAPIKRPLQEVATQEATAESLAKMGRGGRPPARETAATEVDGTDTRGSPHQWRTQCRECTNTNLNTRRSHACLQANSTASACIQRKASDTTQQMCRACKQPVMRAHMARGWNAPSHVWRTLAFSSLQAGHISHPAGAHGSQGSVQASVYWHTQTQQLLGSSPALDKH